MSETRFPPDTSALDACVDLTPVHAQLRALGVDTILRYGAAAPWKCITAGEARSMQQHGLKLALVYETTVKDILLGASEGERAGSHVLTFAPSVGIAPGTGAAVYVTADFDLQSAQMHVALAYLTAFAQACPGYALGLYANGLANDTAYAAGLVKFRWLSQSLGWTGTRSALTNARYELRQYLPQKVLGLDADPNALRASGLDIGARVPWAVVAGKAVTDAVQNATATLGGAALGLAGAPTKPTPSENALRRILDIMQELVNDAQLKGTPK